MVLDGSLLIALVLPFVVGVLVAGLVDQLLERHIDVTRLRGREIGQNRPKKGGMPQTMNKR